MFRLKRKTKTEYITPEFYKDWGNAAYELECLGRRLDSAREAIKRSKPDSWAHNHWTEAEAIILRKWKHTIRLKDTGLRQANKKDTGPTINYDWWENAEEAPMSMPLFDSFYHWMIDKTSNTNLDRIWEIAIQEKIQKARQGLA